MPLVGDAVLEEFVEAVAKLTPLRSPNEGGALLVAAVGNKGDPVGLSFTSFSGSNGSPSVGDLASPPTLPNKDRPVV